ncbi:uridine kinase [Quadrisphaera sp. DSM 44207]|uniref:uridine kinase family protein n=1 Tax=Quadrisphaera sp. DSM 44207 TaxID=1881057 RepID=UPI00089220A0|nr:uridine kinase [Quadrisphaera sp. DSM 44207]SDQ11661.1 uridine kinase [Quadrisphaera sp. DSM 44207]
MPTPPARVVLLCGPSGSGKTSLVRRLGLPTLSLDDFYRDADDPGDPPLPHRFGIVDWDDVRSWDAEAALACLRRLCEQGVADVPVYDIPTSRRTGTARLDLAGSRVVLAEGVFAAHLVAPCREAGLLADAVCLRLGPWATFWRRLLRDLAEGRKRPSTLLRRGWALRRAEPELVARWTALGCRPLHPADAERAVRALAAAGG